MARWGRKRRLELEAQYWRLPMTGVGSVEACRRLGGARLQLDYLPETTRSGRCSSLVERRRTASLVIAA